MSNIKCPKCGKHWLRSPLVRNSLTRRKNVPYTYVCSWCGQQEAMEDYAKMRKMTQGAISK